MFEALKSAGFWDTVGFIAINFIVIGGIKHALLKRIRGLNHSGKANESNR